MKIKTILFGNVYQFKDVKEVLAKANELRSGDVLAGVAAASSQERVAAKQVLSEMTVADIRNNPVIAYEDDCVTRLIQDDVNETAYNQIKNWSISELREYVLSDETSVDDIAFTRKGLTSEVVAAVAKICSNADLIYGAKKMPVIKKANTTIGIPDTFSARLQPNDTRDDVQSIAAQIYEGLSFGVGDAVIGVNPVTDDVGKLKPRAGYHLWRDRQIQHPNSGLRTGARHHPDRSDSSRRAWRTDFPEYLWQRKRAERVWRGTGDARRSARSGRRVQSYRRGKLPLLRNRTRLCAIRWR